jgi:predicted membrane protein
MKYSKTKTLVLAAMFLALGMVLPSITGSIKEIGDSLLPLHLVVMLCGVICGWKYALPVGLMLPFLRSVFFGMPPIYPNAVWMALELATYGFVIGFLFALKKKYSRFYLLLCLIASMICGRIVWGIAKAALLGIAGKPFGIQAFIAGGFLDAIPGIVIQLILIPLIIELLVHLRGKKE